MTSPTRIPLHAAVDVYERPALEAAAALLSKELSAAAGSQIATDCVFLQTTAGIQAGSNIAIAITSLLPELENLEEAWPEAEKRLRAAFRLAAQHSDLRLFVMTIFRHVAPEEWGEKTVRLRVRIARLNLFAAEISRETGCNVIDIDRVLADIGAQVLRTDYRLGGPYAMEAVATNIVLTLLSLGLDEYAPYEIQEATRETIAAQWLSWKNQLAPSHEIIHQGVMSLGVGRRKQRVSLVVNTVQEKHVSRLLHGVLTRQISLPDAFTKLARVIERRGWRESFAALFGGAITLLRDRIWFTRSHQ